MFHTNLGYFLFSESTSRNPPEGRSSKKRYSESEKNSSSRESRKMIPSQTTSWNSNDSLNDKSDISKVSESSPCDLIIDESRDT